MKPFTIVLFCLWSTVWAQSPAAMSPDTVVARIDGKPITAKELMMIVQISPPEAQKNLLKDGKAFIEQLALMKKLADIAETAHLDQQSPVKEQLDAYRRQTLANAQLALAHDSVATTISAADQKKFYEDNRDQYTQAKVKALFVSFRSNPAPQTDLKAKKYVTEPEAKAKIEKLLKQIRGGADFVKLVKENSDDAESVARDGDLFGAPIRRSDKLPDDVKAIIFALKPGEVSEPLRTPSGFYLFRLDELTTQTYEQVQSDIFVAIQQKRFEEWFDKIKKSLDVKIEAPDFFSTAAAASAAAKQPGAQ